MTNPDYLSIWDAAHHWHNLPAPNAGDALMAPGARDTATALLHAVLDGSLVVYEPIVLEVGEEDWPGSRIYMHAEETTPAAIAEAYVSGVYDRKLLAYYRLSSESLFLWLARAGIEIPAFIPIPEWASTKSVQLVQRPDVADRQTCQAIAIRIWADKPQLRIAEMARTPEIQVEGNGRLYQEATLIRWLREVAPQGVRGRAGRPLKRVDADTK
jgi:hypothetical protein